MSMICLILLYCMDPRIIKVNSKMEPQKIVFPITLPKFIDTFKDTCLTQILPIIDKSIQVINNASDPVIYLLIIIVFIQLVRVALVQAQNQKQKDNSEQSVDSFAVAKEIRDLKKELKGLQKTVQTIKSQQKAGGSSSVSQNSNQSFETEQIISYCQKSWEKREKLAQHILDYQTKLMEEVKKIKDKSRISSSSKPQSSGLKQPSHSKPKVITQTSTKSQIPNQMPARDVVLPRSQIRTPAKNEFEPQIEQVEATVDIQQANQLSQPYTIQNSVLSQPSQEIKKETQRKPPVPVIPEPIDVQPTQAPVPEQLNIVQPTQIQAEPINPFPQPETNNPFPESEPTESMRQQEQSFPQPPVYQQPLPTEPVQPFRAPPTSNRPLPPKPGARTRPGASRQAPPPPPAGKR